jgi:hypothetical protein
VKRRGVERTSKEEEQKKRRVENKEVKYKKSLFHGNIRQDT